MVRGQKKHILSEQELANLRDEKREISETRATLDGQGMEQYGQGTPASGADRAALERQERALDEAIRAGSPGRVTGMQKDKMAREAAELESKITNGMPTRAEMELPQRYPGAVRKHMMWEQRNTPDIQRWKQLQRQLNPGDPTCSSVERLRREK